jgi:two-component system response regulator
VERLETGGQQGGTILIVEDNSDDLELTLRALRRHNLANEIVVASDGAEALDWLFAEGAHTGRSPRSLPSVVLLDLRLPKLDGLQVLERIRAHHRTALVPVVVLTSSKDEEDRLRGYELGVNSYVQKPVDFQRFSEAVRQLGLYWMLLNDPPPWRPGRE